MLMSQVKFGAALLLTVGVIATGIGLLTHNLWASAVPLPEAVEKAKVEETGKTEPPGVPLELRLVAKKDTYTLDLGGKTAEQFRKDLTDNSPNPPSVDLVLELRNTGKQELTVCLNDGEGPGLRLDLQGPDAESRTSTFPGRVNFGNGKTLVIAPGKSHTEALKSLRFGSGRHRSTAYWLKTGDYTLTASYPRLGVSPAPKDAKEVGNLGKGFGNITITSNPVKLQVEEKK